MLKRFLIFFVIILFSFNCSNSQKVENGKDINNVKKPEDMYIVAKNLFDNGNYGLANEEFLEITKLYPLSNEAIQSEIMLGFINYLMLDYDNATLKFDKIINKYPAHKNLDYVYYMKAMCFYEQITHHGLDGKYNELAYESFMQVVNRFPESNYASDSRQKIILVKSNTAAKHMEIGRFYLNQKKYTAALNRFKIIIEEYSMTKFTPEALHRMVEAYYEIGMFDESKKTASVLGHNYPNSKWYKYSYNLINNIDDKNSLFEKVKNIF